MRQVLVLGSTGSIGTQALDVIESNGDLQLAGIATGRQWQLAIEQAERFDIDRICIADPEAAATAAKNWDSGEVLSGSEGLVRMITESNADLVLNAIVGAAGLGPTVATLGEGIDLALANKESLVIGGELVTRLAEGTGAQILPVDSEHSALLQLVAAAEVGALQKLVLTASGGPFRGYTEQQLSEVTVEAALKHPTWQMGGKITVDSATLMNKGLEVIEAHYLFGLSYEQIDVVVHPQSIVHALVNLCDGSTLAHLGHPDMGVPISYALSYPDRAEYKLRPLDLAAVGSLEFSAPDESLFKCLSLARQAGIDGGTAPCVLNAANEVAVHAFLEQKLAFMQIAEVVDECLQTVENRRLTSFDTLFDVDQQARLLASQIVDRRLQR